MLLSLENVTPQKLKSTDLNRSPFRQVVKCSRSVSTSPLAMSSSVVRVEKVELEYPRSSPENTVMAPTRPSGEIRVRLGAPSSLMVRPGLKPRSNSTALYVVSTPRSACRQIPRPFENDTRSQFSPAA